jgi:threonyl-tRNA synthetase
MAPEKTEKPKKAKVVPVQSKSLELSPPPEYIAHRITMFERLKAIQDEENAKQPRNPIKVTLPDGKVLEGTSWETSPATIAKGISKSLFERTVISRVNGDLWDMVRPLEGDCTLEFLDFSNDEAKKVFWHSSAHILGEAAERRFGCHLCVGPPTDDGYFYEFGLPNQDSVTTEDDAPLTAIMTSIVKEKQPFERLLMSKADLLEMFKSNNFKQQLIESKIPDGTSTTVYRCGPLIDLCRGPHVPDTGRIKSHAILKVSTRNC